MNISSPTGKKVSLITRYSGLWNWPQEWPSL